MAGTPAWNPPNTTGASNGAFRVDCSIGHIGFDDPIVHPGASGTTHLHSFTGNIETSAASDLSDVSLTGNSTCFGGRANASGYWAPVPFYHCPAGAVGCDRTRDGEIVTFAPLANVYYKRNGSDFGPDCKHGSYGGTPVTWAPIGFRAIVGNANSRVNVNANTQGGGTLRFACFGGADNGIAGGFYDHIITTAESTADATLIAQGVNTGCTQLNMRANIPDCYDGHLDSPNHQSHTQFLDFTNGCTDPAFPFMIITPGMNQHFGVKQLADWDYIRRSSDPACADEGGVAGTANRDGKPNNGQPGGWTLHMDWVNGWNHNANFLGLGKGSITDIILKNCINLGTGADGLGTPRNIDCHDVKRWQRAGRRPLVATRRPAGADRPARAGLLMKALALAALLSLVATSACALAPVPSDEQAQEAHRLGQCGTPGPGTGLTVTPTGSRGWVVSMLPGPHEFRIVGVGAVGVTLVKKTRLDIDAGRPYFIVIDGSSMQGRLEWKVPGSDWGPVSRYFLSPDPQSAPGGLR